MREQNNMWCNNASKTNSCKNVTFVGNIKEKCREAFMKPLERMKLIYVNRWMCELLEYSESELLDMTVYDVAPVIRAGVYQHLYRVKLGDALKSYTLRTVLETKNGTLIPAKISADPIILRRDTLTVVSPDEAKRGYDQLKTELEDTIDRQRDESLSEIEKAHRALWRSIGVDPARHIIVEVLKDADMHGAQDDSYFAFTVDLEDDTCMASPSETRNILGHPGSEFLGRGFGGFLFKEADRKQYREAVAKLSPAKDVTVVPLNLLKADGTTLNCSVFMRLYQRGQFPRPYLELICIPIDKVGDEAAPGSV